ncbi:MAG: DUF4149 domain-containing protein [Burkholderiales bacterium]|nr:DUF4149 domain-containing protein [Burkholderiales bacterium]
MTQVRKKSKSSAAKNMNLAKSKTHSREIISIHQFSKLAMTFWLGGTWMAGIVIFPVLFKTLDQITASEVVGQILNIQAYIGIICLIIALVEVVVNHKLSLFTTKRFWYIICMFSILVVNYFAIFSVLANLRSRLSTIAHKFIALQNNIFDFWHSLSAVLFVFICILGVLYLIEM